MILFSQDVLHMCHCYVGKLEGTKAGST